MNARDRRCATVNGETYNSYENAQNESLSIENVLFGPHRLDLSSSFGSTLLDYVVVPCIEYPMYPI
jgi:hypothetical protein